MKRSILFAAATLIVLVTSWLVFRPKSPPQVPIIPNPTPRATAVREPIESGNHATTEDRLAGLMKTDGSAAAFAAAKAMTGKERDSALFFLFTYAATKDPEFAAKEFATTDLSDVYRKMIADTLASQWNDPERAYEWVQRDLTGDIRKSAIATVLGRIAQISPQRAIDEIGKLSDKQERNQAYGTVILYWADTDFPAALKHMQSLTDEADRSSLSITLASRWAEKDPASAKTELASGKSSSLASIQLAHHVALNEAKKNPKGTLEWASGVGGETGTRAVRTALRAWVAADPAAAAAYVEGADASVRKQLEPALAGLWAAENPAAAAAWVARRSASDEQADLAIQVVHRWADKDLNATRAWIDSLPAGLAKDRSRTLLDQRLASPADRRFRTHPDLYKQSTDDSMFPLKMTMDYQ